jgi:hypothetical protein
VLDALKLLLGVDLPRLAAQRQIAMLPSDSV